MCKNGANLAFHACLQQNGVTALTPENAERKLTKKKMPPSDCINCCTRKFGMNSINHHFSFRDSSWLLVINWFVIGSMYNLQTQRDIFMLNENEVHERKCFSWQFSSSIWMSQWPKIPFLFQVERLITFPTSNYCSYVSGFIWTYAVVWVKSLWLFSSRPVRYWWSRL